MAIYISRMGVKLSSRPLLDWAVAAFPPKSDIQSEISDAGSSHLSCLLSLLGNQRSGIKRLTPHPSATLQ